MQPTDIVILSATRTPLGSFQGALASVSAPQLGAAAIKGALENARVSPDTVTDVIMGNVLQAGIGQAPARQAAIRAGLPTFVRCVTVNKVCGSGLQAILQASQMLQSGLGGIVIAGGMENMSSAPYLLPKARDGFRLGHQQVVDSMIHDGLWDPYQQIHMGTCAEACAAKYHISRLEQDAYAIESFKRATSAQAAGNFEQEITPVTLAGSRGTLTTVNTDEGPSRAKYDRIPTLKPAFDANGTITAANASTLNDGAAALALTTAGTAEFHRLKPIARIAGFGLLSRDPAWFTTAPAIAARQALQRCHWFVPEIDLWEVNEAFAVVPIAFARELGISHDRMNVNGGAISLGHPIGASGARIVVTLLAALRERNATRGVGAICIGGGEGLAICVELL